MSIAQLYEFFYGAFGSCGCGDPDAVAELLREVLIRVRDGKWRDGLEDLLPTDGVMFSYLGWLNHIGLLDHGTGMPGWLTDKGKEILAALIQHGVETEEWEKALEQE